MGLSARTSRDGANSPGWPSSSQRIEWTILFGGLSAGFGMLALNRLPAPYHPVFNAPNFRNGATSDKFFLCLEADDPRFSITDSHAVAGDR